jgi:hypothetical protein
MQVTLNTLQQDYAVTNKRTLREATACAVAEFLAKGNSITVASAQSKAKVCLTKHLGRTNVYGINK